MTATVTSINSARHPLSRTVQYSEIVKESDSLLHYCLMLLEQLDVVRSGHTIDITRRTLPAAVTRAQASLLERGYPTEFKEGGEHGFGYLIFA
ncbi:MAG: hypothetical protein P4L53_08880 [Candidatus Obscuribacterales bacterium]|nr:hypothetical protein [Candidatus Obscuribacterales bacterium]